jgi:malonyl-CoA O-methyltransferase
MPLQPSQVSPPADAGAARGVQTVALLHQLKRLHRLSQPPWLHAEVAGRMAQRLPIVKLQPRSVLDWSSWLGASTEVLGTAYPKAHRLQVQDHEPPGAIAKGARPWWSPQRWVGAQPLTMPREEVPAAAADLVWANMALHHEADLQLALQSWHRALAVDGFLMFSTLGPGSLRLLAEVYSQAGWAPPFAPFVDMHDLGDMLLHAGFADPVMDQEPLTLTWANPAALLHEVRQWGGNAHPARFVGLRTPRWKLGLEAALARRAGPDGRIALTLELVYGHAFKALPKPRMGAHTEVSLEDMRSMARARRPMR